jgi:hypothetical protein
MTSVLRVINDGKHVFDEKVYWKLRESSHKTIVFFNVKLVSD